MVDNLESVIVQSGYVKAEQIADVVKLNGDASSKQHFRIKLKNHQKESVILLKFAGSAGPLHSGKKVTQDHAFVELSSYLYKNNIPVPETYWSNLEMGYTLEEDLGDIQLANFLAEDVSSDLKYDMFSQALSWIPKLQALPADDDCIIFKRKISFENYLEESLRFITFYLKDKSVTDSETEIIRKTINTVCAQVAEQSQVPIYRDLMPWNVMIVDEKVRLVDFQDMIIAAHAYDLASLLHDRDTDLLLGDELLGKLLKYYCGSEGCDQSFIKDYHHCLAQRSFRLAGQFLNLTVITGFDSYKNWVPGCMHRLGRILSAYDEYAECTDILKKLSIDFKSGAESPYALTI